MKIWESSLCPCQGHLRIEQTCLSYSQCNSTRVRLYLHPQAGRCRRTALTLLSQNLTIRQIEICNFPSFLGEDDRTDLSYLTVTKARQCHNYWIAHRVQIGCCYALDIHKSESYASTSTSPFSQCRSIYFSERCTVEKKCQACVYAFGNS